MEYNILYISENEDCNQLLSEVLKDLNSENYKNFLLNRKIFFTYKAAQKFCKDNNLELEAHHIIPRSYQIKELKIDRYSDLWWDYCVLLTREEHLKAHYILAKDLGGYFTRIFAGMVHFSGGNINTEGLDLENPEKVVELIREGGSLKGKQMNAKAKERTPEEKRISIEKGKIARKETLRKHPEIWEEALEKIREANRSPEKRRVASEKQKKNWNDPVYRENQLKSFRSDSCKEKQSQNNGMHNQEVRDKISGERNVMKNPEIRKKHLEICRSEEHREKLRKAYAAHPERNAMKNPIYREKHRKVLKLRSLVYKKLKNINPDISWYDFLRFYADEKYAEIVEAVLLENEELRV